ncbi:MAG: hypothetical protein ACLURV_10170 [Gallintestinimicrobium sp.]
MCICYGNVGCKLYGSISSDAQKMCGLIGVYSLVTAVLICLGYNVLFL